MQTLCYARLSWRGFFHIYDSYILAYSGSKCLMLANQDSKSLEYIAGVEFI